MAVARFRDGKAVSAPAAGILAGDKAEESCEVRRFLKSSEVPDLHQK